jgi:hypothetical protein
MRVVATCAIGAVVALVLGFCLFGYLASGELSDASSKLTWRLLYCAVAGATVGGAFAAVHRIWRRP